MSCPDAKSLRQLLTGSLTGDAAEQMEQHLLGCDDCAATADTISADDDLTAAIQADDPFPADDEFLSRVIERGKQLSQSIAGRNTEARESEETIIADESVAADAASLLDEHTHFLDTSDVPNEIGSLAGYRIFEVLGAGGMGVVFRAVDSKLKRQVALKAMKPAAATSRTAKDRFLREARAAAAIDHDNVVSIYEVDEDRDIPFIAMQYLRGESLKTRVDRLGTLNQREALQIGREVADGLAAAHERGLIHRDIKPDNIWLEEKTESDRLKAEADVPTDSANSLKPQTVSPLGFRCKIVDFGLVRSADDDTELTHSGVVLGTPRFMSPEQAQGEPVDHRCDLFSLGSVLYRLCAGRAPFQGTNLTSMLVAVAHDAPVPIETVCPRLDPKFAQLIGKLLSKDPDERIQSAAEVTQQIRRIEHRLRDDPESQLSDATVLLDSSPVRVHPQAPEAFSDASHARHRKTMLGLSGLFAAAALAAVVTFVTSKGTVTIDIPNRIDGKVQIEILGENGPIAVLDKQNNWTVKVSAGKYALDLQGGNDEFHLKDDMLAVSRFGKKIIEIKYTPTVAKRTGRTSPNSGESPSGPKPGEVGYKNHALTFDGTDDYVGIDRPNEWIATPMTIEATVVSAEMGPRLSAVYQIAGFKFRLYREGPQWMHIIYYDEGSVLLAAPERAQLNRRVHLAGVVDETNAFLFVDGKLLSRVPLPDGFKPRAVLTAGCIGGYNATNAEGFFAGRIDEVRISNIARYRGDFTPARRFEPDESTLALYHFDEGTGDLLKDSSGNGHHGRIHGATWVPVREDE